MSNVNNESKSVSVELRDAFIATKRLNPHVCFMEIGGDDSVKVDLKFNNVSFVRYDRNFYWNPLSLLERIKGAYLYFKWLSIENSGQKNSNVIKFDMPKE